MSIPRICQWLIGKTIKSPTITETTVMSISDQHERHHYSQDLIVKCQSQTYNLWLYVHQGEFKLQDPSKLEFGCSDMEIVGYGIKLPLSVLDS